MRERIGFNQTISVLPLLFCCFIACCQCLGDDCKEMKQYDNNKGLFYKHRDDDNVKHLTFHKELFSKSSRRNNSFIDLSCLRGYKKSGPQMAISHCFQVQAHLL